MTGFGKKLLIKNIPVAAMIAELLCSTGSRAAEINARIQGYKYATPSALNTCHSSIMPNSWGVKSTYDKFW